LVLAMACTAPVAAVAQSYRFAVPQMDLQVYVQPDASTRLSYRIVFENNPAGQAIDVVDVGLPNRDYRISTMKAALDGQPLREIRKSTYIDVGVEVRLPQPIAPGARGTFKFECTMPDMVWADTTDKSYASLQIVPTWFDPGSQEGRTALQVAIHLLPGVDAQQIKYQNEQYKYTDLVLFGDGPDKHPVAIWQYPSWVLSNRNPKLAVSFPRTGMQRVATIGPWGMLMKWYRENPGVRLASIGGLVIVWGITFFRFSHGTGFVLFFLLAAVGVVMALASPGLSLMAWPAMIGLMLFNERMLRRSRTEKSYLPAMATVEGGGIKRGLTAPQAAVLLELPMGKVLTLVIFGMLRKGVLEQVQADPLTVKVSPMYAVARKQRLQAAGTSGSVLHDYEHAFIDRLVAYEQPVSNCNFNEPLGGLVRSVASRMSGFDLNQTRTYYRAIIERAMKEAQSVGEIQQRDKVVDRDFDWILLDEAWAQVFENWARRGSPYRPGWDRRRSDSGPVIISSDGGPGGGWNGGVGGGSGTPETSRTSLGEVAASFVGWTENTMASFASAVEPAKMGLDVPRGGIVDLSGLDRVTGDVLKALADNAVQGRGSGGGSGCACACAGCACACACAGGGR
jgi:hypothetical protein